MEKKQINYIELFSGIGAFTQAIQELDYIDSKCVFAADINKQCAEVYEKNYKIDSLCDLTKKNENDIPNHNFCFFSPPCQAFSKSGKRLGFEEARGTLIYEVFRILKHSHPKYILMENVRNLVSHDGGNTIKVILGVLHDLGYQTTETPIILSPHQFGIPQTRERAFLPGIYNPGKCNLPLDIKFESLLKKTDCEINDIVDHSYDKDKTLLITKHEINLLNIWDDFYKNIDIDVIGFPVWYDYFFDLEENDEMAEWKKDFVRKNKELYNRNKKFIDSWAKKNKYLKDYTPTQRKFEWQAGNKIKSIWEGVIQIRPSGVRVKVPTTFPALVAIVQIPIIGSLKRRLSVSECAKLQSFSEEFIPSKISHVAYKQFGNSINVVVLKNVIKKLLDYDK